MHGEPWVLARLRCGGVQQAGDITQQNLKHLVSFAANIIEFEGARI